MMARSLARSGQGRDVEPLASRRGLGGTCGFHFGLQVLEPFVGLGGITPPYEDVFISLDPGMGLERIVFALRDADMELRFFISTTEQQILEDERLGEAGAFRKKAASYGGSGPGSAPPGPGRCGGALWKHCGHPPQSFGHAVAGARPESCPDADGEPPCIQK